MNVQDIYNKAHAAGLLAGAQVTPTPMNVVGYGVVLDGPCGFAWVKVDGRSAFGKLVRSKFGDATVWVNEFGQSLARKAAYAHAFAAVLREHNIKCHAASQID